MKRWFSNLNICYKTAIISTIVILIAFLVTSCFFWLNLMEIPLGIILGGLVGVMSYVFLGLTNNEVQKKTVGTIIVTITRFLVLAGVIFLAAWLYYQLNLHIFNVFAVTGSYLVPVICLCVLVGKEKMRNV